MRIFPTVVVFVRSGGTLHQQFGAHPSVRLTTPQHMAAKKKGDATTTSADTMTTTTPPQDEGAAGQDPPTGNEDISIEDIAEGQQEVDLLDLGISAEDIAAMRRVDARLEEARRAKRQALQEETTEPQIIMRAKGKEIMLTEAERQEQYNKLQEEELRCKALQGKIRAQRLLLEKMQAPQPPPPLPKNTSATNPPRHAQRVRTRTIPIEEISDQSEPEEEEYYRRGQPRRTPLYEELEEIQWPHRLNPAVLPQFDGESDPEEFLLKYKATIEAAGGGTTCEAKALVGLFLRIPSNFHERQRENKLHHPLRDILLCQNARGSSQCGLYI